MMPRKVDRIADPPATAPSAHTLFGRDHQPPGAVATAVLGDGAIALGLARGWRPKPYAYVDPNEDVVAAVVGPRAHLLVVADGHNGVEASHLAVGAAVDLLGVDPPPADLADEEVIDVAVQIERRIATRVSAPGPRSRTTLVVALRTATALQWFGVGDSALLIIDGADHRALPAATRWFLGDRVDAAGMRRTLARGRVDLPFSAWVTVASDGYTDYLPENAPAAVVAAQAIDGATTPYRAVCALLEQARRGGAGDNVGVAVSGPWYKPHDGHHHVADRHG
ncbi:MAG: protein phosphatase 2C domain-containing protein [Actinobacteria bacterium]|nr:protein phosphatase 2C domain-containing protein [Actinomycetota bacterium]